MIFGEDVVVAVVAGFALLGSGFGFLDFPWEIVR